MTALDLLHQGSHNHEGLERAPVNVPLVPPAGGQHNCGSPHREPWARRMVPIAPAAKRSTYLARPHHLPPQTTIYVASPTVAHGAPLRGRPQRVALGVPVSGTAVENRPMYKGELCSNSPHEALGAATATKPHCAPVGGERRAASSTQRRASEGGCPEPGSAELLLAARQRRRCGTATTAQAAQLTAGALCFGSRGGAWQLAHARHTHRTVRCRARTRPFITGPQSRQSRIRAIPFTHRSLQSLHSSKVIMAALTITTRVL